jgi:hypothetical protein
VVISRENQSFESPVSCRIKDVDVRNNMQAILDRVNLFRPGQVRIIEIHQSSHVIQLPDG